MSRSSLLGHSPTRFDMTMAHRHGTSESIECPVSPSDMLTIGPLDAVLSLQNDHHSAREHIHSRQPWQTGIKYLSSRLVDRLPSN